MTTETATVAAAAAPARPMRADARRNYDAIVHAAVEAFAASGTHASLDDIACRAGVGPGTLYRHFPTRDCLITAALVDSREELSRTASELLATDDPGRALDEWIFNLARHSSTYSGLPDTIAHALRDAQSPLGLSCQGMVDTTKDLLAQAQAKGAIRAEVTADDLNVLAGSVAWAASQGRRSDDDVRRLIGLIVGGLR